MRIYIDQLSLTADTLAFLTKVFAPYQVKTAWVEEIVTNEGWFQLVGENLLSLGVIDGKIERIKVGQFSLLVDTSKIHWTRVPGVYGVKQMHRSLEERRYQLHNKARAVLVLQIDHRNREKPIHNLYLEECQHGQFRQDELFHQELNELISLLN